jgi:hypothetical protein
VGKIVKNILIPLFEIACGPPFRTPVAASTAHFNSGRAVGRGGKGPFNLA